MVGFEGSSGGPLAVFESSMTPIKEIEVLAYVLRKQIRAHATVGARYAKFVALECFADAKKKYIEEVRASDEYQKMKETLKEIIDDCVEKFKMERWWAEAFLGIDLDRELMKEFDKAWKEAQSEV